MGYDDGAVVRRATAAHESTREDAALASVLQEEAYHLAGGVGPGRLGKRSGRTTAGPSMADTVQNPLLHHGLSGVIGLSRAGEIHAPGDFAVNDGRLEIRRSARLGNDLVAIRWIDCRVGIAMKYDRGNAPVRKT